MKKILFYFEPVIFRNDPLFLLPHIRWAKRICNNLSLGCDDIVLIVSSPPLCRKAAIGLSNSTGNFNIQTDEVCIQSTLEEFKGCRQAYAQDLYSSANLPVINGYLWQHIQTVISDFNPDLIVSSAENRYISAASLRQPRKVGTFFIEKAPLPSWATNGRIYLDCFGHQTNSTLACNWEKIINTTYKEHEITLAKSLINEIEIHSNKPENKEIQNTLRCALDNSKETILVALQPDEWLSWEGAIKKPLKPLDVLARCCADFSDYNVIPTFHQGILGIRSDLLKDLKTIYPNIIDLPAESLTGNTESLLPAVDHVYTVSSATGISALLYSKCLISDANSFLSGGSVTTDDFLKGKRNQLDGIQKTNLAAFILSRYSKSISNLLSYEDYEAHKEGINSIVQETSETETIDYTSHKSKFSGISFGVFDFSYKHYTHFEKRLKKNGVYTINLGDYIQSIAVRNALTSIGIRDTQIKHIDRDDLTSYDGEKLVVIMNGVFIPSNFPLPENITPVYFGFSYHPENIFPWHTIEDYNDSLDTLKTENAIGCRDKATAQMLATKGFNTYVSGCLSQSLEPNNDIDRSNMPTLICGIDNPQLTRALSQASSSYISLPNQRKAVKEYPLSEKKRNECRCAAESMLRFYNHHVSTAITSLMHCASPCAALGIPTVIVRKDPENIRFTSLSNLLPVESSEKLHDISDLKSIAQTFDVRKKMLLNLKKAIEDALQI